MIKIAILKAIIKGTLLSCLFWRAIGESGKKDKEQELGEKVVLEVMEEGDPLAPSF